MKGEIGDLPIGVLPEEVDDYRSHGERVYQDGDGNTPYEDEADKDRQSQELFDACWQFMKERGLV